ncbi:MAG: ATP-binding protein [Bacteroidota bacterium]
MEWHGAEFSKRSDIKVRFHHPESGVIANPVITIGLFRIYQEALTNVARHAEAKNVKASLELLPDQFSLVIIDDGKGFDSTRKNKSLGLLGMKERAHIMGGTLTINSEPGKGTTVTVSVPLKKT